MTDATKIALAAISGVLVGAAAGATAMHIYDKKKFNELQAQANEELRLHYQRKLLKYMPKAEEVVDVEVIDAPDKVPETPKNDDFDDLDVSHITETHSTLDIQTETPEKVDYHKIHVDLNSTEVYPELDEIRKKMDISRAAPRLCTPDVYFANDADYKYYELNYYTKDYIRDDSGDMRDYPILYNVDTERVMNVSDMVRYVGVEWKSHFGDEDYEYNDMDNVFVINEAQKAVFMITQRDEFYKCDILGMDEDEDYDYPEVEP